MQAALPEDFVTIDRSLRPPGRRRPAPLIIRPFAIHRGFLDGPAQHPLLAEVRRTWEAARPVRRVTRRDKPMSLAMASAGPLTGAVAAMSPRSPAVGLAADPGDAARPVASGDLRSRPARQLNRCRDGARRGLHQDRDEAGLRWPAVPVGLGNEGLVPHRQHRARRDGRKPVAGLGRRGVMGRGTADAPRHRPHPAGRVGSGAGPDAST